MTQKTDNSGSLAVAPCWAFSLEARATIDTPDYDVLDMSIDTAEEPRRLMDAIKKDLPDCEVSWAWKGGYIEVLKTFVLVTGITPDLGDFFERVKASGARHWPNTRSSATPEKMS